MGYLHNLFKLLANRWTLKAFATCHGEDKGHRPLTRD